MDFETFEVISGYICEDCSAEDCDKDCPCLGEFDELKTLCALVDELANNAYDLAHKPRNSEADNYFHAYDSMYKES